METGSPSSNESFSYPRGWLIVFVVSDRHLPWGDDEKSCVDTQIIPRTALVAHRSTSGREAFDLPRGDASVAE